jgi:hypothetical protein
MKSTFKKYLIIFAFLFFHILPAFAQNTSMTPAQMHDWIQEALHYGFDMKTTDYTKYMSTDYVEHIDGKVFDFKQWLHHMKGLKVLMKSYTLTFDEIVAEKDQLATSYVVHAVKKDGSQLDIRIIAIFKIKDGKMIYCDELTHVIHGGSADKTIGSQD